MKLTLIAMTLAFSLSALAAPITGRYELKNDIGDYTASKSDCAEGLGKWTKDGGIKLCVSEVANFVQVSKTRQGYKIHVETYGSNMHSCMYDGAAVLLHNKLESKTKNVSYFNYNTNRSAVGTCIVSAKLEDNGTMTLSDNGKCVEFCGANAWLNAEGLVKIPTK